MDMEFTSQTLQTIRTATQTNNRMDNERSSWLMSLRANMQEGIQA